MPQLPQRQLVGNTILFACKTESVKSREFSVYRETEVCSMIFYFVDILGIDCRMDMCCSITVYFGRKDSLSGWNTRE